MKLYKLAISALSACALSTSCTILPNSSSLNILESYNGLGEPSDPLVADELYNCQSLLLSRKLSSRRKKALLQLPKNNDVDYIILEKINTSWKSYNYAYITNSIFISDFFTTDRIISTEQLINFLKSIDVNNFNGEQPYYGTYIEDGSCYFITIRKNSRVSQAAMVGEFNSSTPASNLTTMIMKIVELERKKRSKSSGHPQ